MKNLIKRFLVNIIFTAEERNVMIDALDYSEWKCRRRGNTDKALLIGIVKSQIQGFFKKGAEKVVENRNEIEKEDYITKKEVKKLIIRTAALTSVFIMDKIRKEVMEIMNIEEDEPKEMEVHVHKYDAEECGECEKKNDENENTYETQENYGKEENNTSF